jgi:hypothetical protein
MKITEEVLSKGEWINSDIFRYQHSTRKSLYRKIKCFNCGEDCLVFPAKKIEGCCSRQCARQYYDKFKDVTGQKFNRLTALYRTKMGKDNDWYWMFKCDCGSVKEIKGNKVWNGKTKSCGCIQRKEQYDLTNKRFDRLVAISKTKQNKFGYWYWNCQCDCGKTKEILSSRLFYGHTKSCGCLALERASKVTTTHGLSKNKQVASYDTYAATLLSVGEKVKRNRENPAILECICKYCGKMFIPTRSQVCGRIDFINGKDIYEHNLYCSKLCQNVCPSYKKTENGYLNQMNGTVPLNREVQPELRQMVFARDSYQCQRCEKTKVSLHCHHFEGIELNPIESADLDNCITLCVPCHELAHSEIGCRKVDMRRKKCQ